MYSAYRHRAARVCILRPFFTFDERKNAALALWLLRKRWYARLVDLREAGWTVLADPKKLTYASNCPPVGVKTSFTTRCCNKSRVCPFCWARQHVLLPFRKFETVLYGASGPYQQNGKLLPVIRPDLKIVSFSIVTSGSAKAEAEFSPEGLPLHWHYLNSRLCYHRRREVDLFNAEYAYVLHKIYPVASRKHIGVVRSGVMLCPDVDAAEVQRYIECGHRVEVAPANKKALFHAMLRSFTYPKPLMCEAPELMAVFLNACKSGRMATWYGGPVRSKTGFEESTDE